MHFEICGMIRSRLVNFNNMKDQADFLLKLQEEAKFQAKLAHSRLLPAKLDWLTSLVGRYPWQTVLFLSVLVSLTIEVLR